MNTVKTVRELRAAVARARREGKQIALVPTMVICTAATRPW